MLRLDSLLLMAMMLVSFGFAQNRDENRWVYHPVIDGCLPVAVDEPPPLH